MVLNNCNMKNMFNFGTGYCNTSGYYDPTSLFSANSIFSQCGQVNYAAIGGFQALNFLGTAILGGAGALISSSKENSISGQETCLEDIDEKIQKELDKLPGVTIDNYDKYDVKEEDDFKTRFDKINTERKKQNAIIAKFNQADYDSAKADYEAAEEAYTEALANDSLGDHTQLLNAKNNKKALFDKQEELKKEHDAAKAALKALEDEENALNDEVETEQAKADKIIENIDNLLEERENVKQNLVTKVFDKADGIGCRNKNLKTSSLKKGTTKFTDNDIRELCHRFTRLSNGTLEKWECARALAELDETTFIKIATPTQIKARKFAKEYIEENNKPTV